MLLDMRGDARVGDLLHPRVCPLDVERGPQLQLGQVAKSVPAAARCVQAIDQGRRAPPTLRG